MYQQVPEYYRSLSERVSAILDVIGYSQEDRDRKIWFATGHDLFHNISMIIEKRCNSTSYISTFGSRGEGSTGPGLNSDRDILYMLDSIEIVTDLSDCELDKYNQLMVHDDCTHPGYVKLQNIRILNNIPYPIFGDQDDNIGVDSYGRELLYNTTFSRVQTPITTRCGPAVHIIHQNKSRSADVVVVLRCTRWPNEGHEWFQRRRLHGWPKSQHLQNAMKDGCFAAAVGHPHSHEKDMEWRLSFSFTERRLIRSFDDTVMKVYVLLKMVKKTYIVPILGDAFSSYHCKVCMLWVRENTPTELWRSENLLLCLTLCIRQLYEWASMGYCPDYFIVTNNVYDRNIFGAAQLILSRILKVLVSEDSQFLLRLECCNLGQLILQDLSGMHITRNPQIIIRKHLAVETFADYDFVFDGASRWRVWMHRCIFQDYNVMTRCIRRIMYALQNAHQTLRVYLHHILITLLSKLGFHLISVCKENAHSLSQEDVNYLIALASECLSLGINSDATSVRLKLCGLGIMLGNYDLTEICLQHISDHKMRYMISCNIISLYTLRGNYDYTTDKCASERYSPTELMQNQLSFSVVYLPSEIPITPIPLRMEMYKSFCAPMMLGNKKKLFWYDWLCVDSLMCLYFFQYLNFFTLGKERHRQAALDNMIHLMKTEPRIHAGKLELNLIGFCFMRESQLRNAFIWFNKSLQICPDDNAAKLYLCILFRRFKHAGLTRRRN